eukprot:TRINITY_DN168_c0_g1_i1.p1 TRINITY_DN168_c0_g1~~TRINITY_DN168_c0_g1_i1.p1  ORF type:complete len:143 (-),score=47.78 TRINITY_DN168_c0_g1_i1:587-970(-)
MNDITLDDNYKIRVLDPQVFDDSVSLVESCEEFTEKIGKFNDITEDFVKIITEQAEKIEELKLKAIGQANRVHGEQERKKRLEAELTSEFQEKKIELDRLTTQYEALLKVEKEQNQTLDRLMNNNDV